MKYGRSSSIPIKISFAIDCLIGVISLWRLQNSKLKKIEKAEIQNRLIYSFLKYLIRDPMFDRTKFILTKLFGLLRLPERMLGILFSVLNYFRYYAYIA